jgi:hypothetical protein
MATDAGPKVANRRRVLKSGRLIFNHKRSAANCIVRNIGEGGVEVRLEGPMALSDDLVLGMDDKLYPARLVSQEGLNLVLEFI